MDKYILNTLMYFMKNRQAKKVNNKNIVTLKVKETVDLTSPLSELDALKQKILGEGEKQKEEIFSKSENLDKKIKSDKKKVGELKDSFDKIIQNVKSIFNL